MFIQAYDKEFQEVEKELEKIYNDPIAAWQEMIKNPSKYGIDELVKDIEEDEKKLEREGEDAAGSSSVNDFGRQSF